MLKIGIGYVGTYYLIELNFADEKYKAYIIRVSSSKLLIVQTKKSQLRCTLNPTFRFEIELKLCLYKTKS